MSSTNQLGDIGELATAMDLWSKGCLISIPFGHDHSYDLIADTGIELLRVQVKTVTPKKGVLIVKNTTTHTTGGGSIVVQTYDKDAYDWMAVFDPVAREVYYIYKEWLAGKSSLQLRLEPTKNNQEKKISWAKDYREFAAVV